MFALWHLNEVCWFHLTMSLTGFSGKCFGSVGHLACCTASSNSEGFGHPQGCPLSSILSIILLDRFSRLWGKRHLLCWSQDLVSAFCRQCFSWVVAWPPLWCPPIHKMFIVQVFGHLPFVCRRHVCWLILLPQSLQDW